MIKQKGTSFIKQAAILGAASLFVRLIGFLYRIPVTNWLGDEGIGFYTRAYFIYTFAVVISSGALPAAVSRLVSERVARDQYRNAHRLFKTAMGFAMFVGVVAGLIMGLGAGWMSEFFDMPEAAHAIRVLAPTIFFVAILAVFRGYFQGMKNAMPTALSQIVEQIFNVVFTVWLVFVFLDAANLQYSVAGGAAGTGIGAIAGVIVVVILYVRVAKDLRHRANSDESHVSTNETGRQQMAVILRTALPIVVGMGVYSAANIIDFGMASDRMAASGAFNEDEINALVGQFTGKFLLLTTLPVALSMALSAAVIPEITTSQVKMDMGAIRRKTNMALRLSMMLSIPAAVGLGVLADPIIALLFPAHPGGGWLLMYGAASIIFLAMVQILTGVLQGIGHVGIPVIGATIGVLSKIPVNYFLIAIPEINILGAVISTIVCYMIAAAINLFFLRKITGILPDFVGAFVKPLISATGMGVVVFVFYYFSAMIMSNRMATLVALGAGFIAYLILLHLIKGFRPEDINALPLPDKIKQWMRR